MALQHRWKFDSHLRDNVGGADALMIGATGALYRSTAYTINGRYVLNTGDGAETESVTINDEFSVSFWVYKSSWAANYFIIGNANYQADGWSIWLDASGGSDYIRFRTSNGSSHAESISSAVTLSGNHHVVITCDRSTGDNVKTYLDGTDVSSSDDDCRTDFAVTGEVRFGVDFSDANDFAGYLENVQVYDTELTSANVTRLYKDAGTAIGGDPDDEIKEIQHRYRFEANQKTGYYADDIGAADGAVVGSAAYGSTGDYTWEGVRYLNNDVSGDDGFDTEKIHFSSGQFSVGVWYKKFGGSGKLALFGNLDSYGDNDGFFVYWDYTNTRIEVKTMNGTDTAYAYSTTPSYASGTLYLISVSFDRDAGTVRIFQNGTDITDSDNDCRTDFRLSGKIRLGLDFDSGGDSYSYFDDLQVYQGQLEEADWAIVAANAGMIYTQQDNLLLVRWKFENNLEDSVNNFDIIDASGVWTGVSFDTSSPSPQEGTYCLEVSAGTHELITPKIPIAIEKHTFAFWVRPGDLGDTINYQYIIGGENLPNQDYDGSVNVYLRELQDSVYTRYYYDSSNYTYTRSNDSVLAEDTWAHVVITYNRSTGYGYIYVNGVQVVNTDTTGTEYIKTNSPYSFCDRYGYDQHLEGWLDDFQIYNDDLSLAEAKFLYANPGLTLYDQKGTISTSSTVTGDLTAAVTSSPIEGTISTSSTVIGDLVGTTELSSTISTSSTVIGDVIGTTELSGTVSTSTTLTGDIVGTFELDGITIGYSSVIGNLIGTTELSGTISTSSTVIVNIVGTTELSGTISTSSTVTGDIIGGSELSGSILTGTTLNNASLVGVFELSGTISTSSSVTGDIIGGSELSGTITTSTSIVGALVGSTELSGTILTSTTLNTPALLGLTELSGTILTYSTVTGNLAAGKIRGAISTSSSVVGDLLGYQRDFSGTISTSTSTTAHLTSVQNISGTISTSSLVSGDVFGSSELSGTVSTAATVVARLVGRSALAGTVSTSSSVFGDARIYGPLSGTISTYTTIPNVVWKAVGHLTGTISTSTNVIVHLSVTLGGQSYGQTTLSATLTSFRRMTGTISTETTLTGVLREINSIHGTISTSTVVSADIDYRVGLRGTIYTWTDVWPASLSNATILSGTIFTSSTVTGFIQDVSLVGKIQGSIITFSTVWPAPIRNAVVLSGTVSTSSTVAGFVLNQADINVLEGSITTWSTVWPADLRGMKRKTGTINTSSTVSNAPIIYKSGVHGTITTSSTLNTPDLIGTGSISGTVTSGTTVAVHLSTYVLVSVTVNTSSAASANISQIRHLTGTITTSTILTSAVIKGMGVLTGVISTSSSLTVDVQAVMPLSGSVSGETSVDGDIIGYLRTTVQVNTATTLSANLLAQGMLSGTVITGSLAQTDVIGYGRRTVAITTGSTTLASISSVCQITGTINTSSTVTSNVIGVTELSGVLSTNSAVQGHLVSYVPISSTVSTNSTVSGKIQSEGAVSGTVSSIMAVQGALLGHGYRTITINTGTANSAHLIGTYTLSGIISTATSVLGSIASYQFITGTISTATTTQSDVIGRSTLSGIVTTNTLLVGEAVGLIRGTGTISTATTVQAQILGTTELTGTISTSTSLVSNIRAKGSLQGTITTHSTSFAHVQSMMYISTSVSTATTVTAKLVGKGPLSTTLLTYSQINTPDLRGIGMLGGITVGLSQVLSEIREKGVERDWLDVVVLPEEVEAVVQSTEFKAKVLTAEYELVAIDPEQKLWVYTYNFGIPVVEDMFRVKLVSEFELVVED